MDAAIEGFLLQLLAVDQDVPGLVGGLSPARFNWRPAADRWSIGQCLEHLNLTTERYVPVLRKALSDGRAKGLTRGGPYSLGLFERWFLKGMEPPPRWRTRTGKAFIAAGELDPVTTEQRAHHLHEELAACMKDAEGLNLQAIKVKSQFGPVRFTLNGTFAILLAHERRHLWQAREVRNHRAFPAA
jgi:hypothetical protein